MRPRAPPMTRDRRTPVPFPLDSRRRVYRVPRIGSSSPALARIARSRRYGGLSLLIVLIIALFLVPAAQTALAPVTAPASADSDLDKLKKKADEAKDELEKANEDYTEREEKLDDAQDELVSTLHDLQQTELRLAELREPLAQVGSTLYMQPNSGVLGILTSGRLDQDLQVESHVLKLSDDREALMEEANNLHDKQSDLASQAQELQTENQLKRVELEDDLDDLR